MTTRSPILMGLAALFLTACGIALGGTSGPGQAQGTQGAAELLPFNCSLVASGKDGGTTLEGRLQAREALAASYALKVRGPGVAIDQEGDLTLAEGESTVLGEASVSGTADSLDATLTVTVDGRSYTCPLQVE
ncbi:MAG TPA: curli-like amyloid fiber formation chaperone CsgH [Rubellimicrobium sp.]|nr:curli-like amyloid fiber formation chaperone CsgH [Rubellimicrobium sp.]